MNQPTLIRLWAADSPQYTLSPYGRTYSESMNMIAREDRAADGTLRRDITAVKKTFTLSYSVIDDAALAMFETIFNTYANAELTLEVTHNTITQTYTVLMRAFERSRLSVHSGGLWENVTLEFDEV